jgi:hypothetical protein
MRGNREIVRRAAFGVLAAGFALPACTVATEEEEDVGVTELAMSGAGTGSGEGEGSGGAPDAGTPPPYTTPPGQCQDYSGGGTTGVHYYTCCNNCPSSPPYAGNIPPPTTYEGGSSGSYCGICGINTSGGTPSGSPYSCGGQYGQSMCQAICNGSGTNHAGLCWAWQDCFDLCCSGGGVPSCPVPDSGAGEGSGSGEGEGEE